jgi:uncharacterized protein YfiM (DUF2279 family)
MKPTPVQNPSPLASLSRARRRTSSTFRPIFWLLVLFLFFPTCFYAQADSSGSGQKSIVSQAMDTAIKPAPYYSLTPEEKRKRQWIIGGLNVVGYGASIIVFNNTWYKDYPKTSFHTFNDSKEWLQMDKMGHVWAAYNASRASAAMWRWAGVSPKKAAWIGGLSSIAYLTVIEILDGHSAKWGWSWSDMAANLFGSALFVSQQIGWEEQRIQFKFSFHYKSYSDPMLNERSDDLFGSTWIERMLKDYNGQTYWLSTNLKSFFPRSNLPAWLNVAIGYGAEGMFGGFENKWTDEDSGVPIDRTDIKRYRQWYLAPDVNFSKIKTNKKAVRVLFDVLDAFKFPAPSLELSNGKVKVHAIHF